MSENETRSAFSLSPHVQDFQMLTTSFMCQSMSSVTISLSGNPRAFYKKSWPGGGFADINFPKGAEFDRGWEVSKTQLVLLSPTQNRLCNIYMEYETEFGFSCKNSKVCSTAENLLIKEMPPSRIA